jgi:hypothetical protein
LVECGEEGVGGAAGFDCGGFGEFGGAVEVDHVCAGGYVGCVVG